VYQYLLGRYKPAKAKASNPTNADINNIKQEPQQLYTAMKPTEPPIPWLIGIDQ
jgi:hypothetical protein